MSSLSRPRMLVVLLLAVALVPSPAGAQTLPGPIQDVLDAIRDAGDSILPGDSGTPEAPAAPEAPGTDGSSTSIPAGAPNVTMKGSGWGHSVGMSQYGARAQAQAGRSVAQILTSYYPGVTVGTGGSVAPETEVRVELFDGRVADPDAQQMRLAARGRNGGASPTTAATVRLGPDRAVRALPPPAQAWTLSRDGGAFVLRDGAGTEMERGPGPVQLAIAGPGGSNPGLLCLPQLGCSASELAGTFQWGFVNIAWDGDAQRMRPVLHVPMELYLRGLAEMPSSWETSALQAQAITGRTYATRRLGNAAWHLDTTPRTQAYSGWAKEGGADGGRWVGAVDSTSRQVVTYQGSLAETYYSSSHGGGRNENVQDSWAFSATTSTFPYLRSVDDPWSMGGGNPHASWTATVSNHEFVRAVTDETGIARIASIGVASRTDGGTPRSLTVRGWTAGGEPVTRAFTGAKNAGATLRLRWPLRAGQPFLRSQQIQAFSVSPFADDDGSLHEYNIWAIAEGDITKGCAAGDPSRYCPLDRVPRAQMAVFLARALNLRVDPNEPDRFRDIAGHPHRAAINAVAREGITGGCNADGTLYCPGGTVTRDQMASFIARGFDLPPGADQRYTDVAADSPHRDAINRIAAKGITTGCARDRFCPREGVTRGQMASFLARALDHGW